jgi:uncharacterized protein (DUF488 family)
MARGLRELLATLHEAGAETLVDVRRSPGSRRNPQFSQATLAAELESAARTCANEPADLLILTPGRA